MKPGCWSHSPSCLRNVVNALFCFGAGYMISTTLILTRWLRKASFPRSFVLLRPLAGGLASAILFLVVLSGGKIVWNQVSGVNVLALGIISVVGSVYCERLDRILKLGLQSRNAKKREKTQTARL